jgi:Caspase domain/RNA binding activity-knot of a chromodomain
MTRILSRLNGRVAGTASLIMLLYAFVFVTPAEALARERDWQPQRTWVFVVGALRFKHEEMFDSFPQENRRDAELVSFFRQQGVPTPQIVYLRDREATAQKIESAFARHLSRAREGDWLFLYYTGHGYRPDDDDESDAYLASYDAGDEGVPGWRVNSIPATIERYFKGSHAFLTLDNCYSGSLVEAVRERTTRVSYAVLTSASSDQVSTAEWTFTEGLLAALRGKSYEDSNNDGHVTLGEMAEQVKEDMSFAERQRAAFATTGDFSPQTVLSRAERKRDARIGERVLVRSDGDWFKGRIIDVDQEDSEFLIHYYGWDDSYDEWVNAAQIRRPRATRATFGRKRLEGRLSNSFGAHP